MNNNMRDDDTPGCNKPQPHRPLANRDHRDENSPMSAAAVSESIISSEDDVESLRSCFAHPAGSDRTDNAGSNDGQHEHDQGQGEDGQHEVNDMKPPARLLEYKDQVQSLSNVQLEVLNVVGGGRELEFKDQVGPEPVARKQKSDGTRIHGGGGAGHEFKDQVDGHPELMPLEGRAMNDQEQEVSFKDQTRPAPQRGSKTIQPQQAQPVEDEAQTVANEVNPPVAMAVYRATRVVVEVNSTLEEDNKRNTTPTWTRRKQLGAMLIVFVLGVAAAVIAYAVVGDFGGSGDSSNALTVSPTTLILPEPSPPTMATTSPPSAPPTVSPTDAPTDQRFCGRDAWCWAQLGPDLEADFFLDDFGRYVSLARNGTRLAVSAPLHDATGNSEYQDIGFVRVYDIIEADNMSEFVQLGETMLGKSGDQVYGVLSKDGSRLAIGARYHTLYDADATRFNIGQVRVFRLEESQPSWELMGDALYGENGEDNFGTSIALSQNGSVMVVGASGHDGATGPNSGRVKVLSYSVDTWEELGFGIEGESANDWVGGSVSISDDGLVIAVGAENANDSAGHVRVFRFEAGEWTQLGGAINGTESGDEFGSSISLSVDGKTLAAGAWANHGGGTIRGHVRVFTYDDESNRWEGLGSEIHGLGDYDRIYQVALSDNGWRIATSSSSAYNGTGYVLVFEYDGNDWVQLGGEIEGQTTGEEFGASISISSDGTRLAVGATASYAKQPKGVVRMYELRPA